MRTVTGLAAAVMILGMTALPPASAAGAACATTGPGLTYGGIHESGKLIVVGTASSETIDCSAATVPVLLHAGAGNDLVYGSPYDDWLYGDAGSDTIRGGGGGDAIVGNDGSEDTEPPFDPAGSADGNNRLYGEDGSDGLWGAAGNDVLEGGPGDDFELYGGFGDDVLDGGPGSEELIDGGGGSDLIWASAGTDRMMGCGSICATEPDVFAGHDVVDYGRATRALNLRLDNRSATVPKWANHQLGPDVDEVRGTAYADSMTGSAFDDVLVGRGGTDSMNGLAGRDRCLEGERLRNCELTG